MKRGKMGRGTVRAGVVAADGPGQPPICRGHGITDGATAFPALEWDASWGMLTAERRCWEWGCARVAGIDEAGRGPLAGPVVAAAVVLDRPLAECALDGLLAGLTDSKQLTRQRREAFYALLCATPGIDIGVGLVDNVEIDRLNILRATHAAMARAVSALGAPPDHALVDGRPVSGLSCRSSAIVKGDARSLSIAAASVVAKVVRDACMVEADRRYPVYGFRVHKGYGTSAHMLALFEHGPCAIHRRSFRPVRDAAELRERAARGI